jgi:hypothetical protein
MAVHFGVVPPSGVLADLINVCDQLERHQSTFTPDSSDETHARLFMEFLPSWLVTILGCFHEHVRLFHIYGLRCR